MSAWWMVRAGRGSAYSSVFLEHNVVAFGGVELGALPEGLSRGELVKLIATKHPEGKPGTLKSWAFQLYRFLHEMKGGDQVVTYDHEQRIYYIGKVTTGDYTFEPIADSNLAHCKAVEWTGKVLREVLSASTRNSLGAIQTLFRLPAEAVDNLKEHQQNLEAPIPEVSPGQPTQLEPEDKSAEEDFRRETLEKADLFIEDAINRLDWEQMQDFVAGILRAMGYRTRVAPPGPDRGHDIFASPDGLGLQEPRIFVEVKHRKGAMGAPQIRSFLGGRSRGDRCLYVSTGGFTREARYEAERAAVPLQLIDLPLLRELLVDHYEKLDAETRAMVPLKRIYWPA